MPLVYSGHPCGCVEVLPTVFVCISLSGSTVDCLVVFFFAIVYKCKEDAWLVFSLLGLESSSCNLHTNVFLDMWLVIDSHSL